MALARLVNHHAVEAANAKAAERYLAAQPRLDGVGVAREVLPGMGERTILHAGPPIAWERMCGPMRGAIVGAILYEGWADDADAARELAARGEIAFEPCHHHARRRPDGGNHQPVDAGVDRGERHRTATARSATSTRAWARCCASAPTAARCSTRLEWMAATFFGQRCRSPFEVLGECRAQAADGPGAAHGRRGAQPQRRRVRRSCSSAWRRRCSSPSARRGDAAAAIEFIAGNDHFFLNISMAACKAMLDAAHGVAGSSMVTAMARNGVDFGIRVSGTGERWFTGARADRSTASYFPGYTIDDAAPDLGDSAITETAGLGGFAMAAAPAIVKFVGGTPAGRASPTRRR